VRYPFSVAAVRCPFSVAAVPRCQIPRVASIHVYSLHNFTGLAAWASSLVAAVTGAVVILLFSTVGGVKVVTNEFVNLRPPGAR
jgi:hypothetical protein